MQINFHSLLWSYLPRVPIFLAMGVRLGPDLNRCFTPHYYAFFIVFIIIMSNCEALVNTKQFADINFSSFPPLFSTHSLISLSFPVRYCRWPYGRLSLTLVQFLSLRFMRRTLSLRGVCVCGLSVECEDVHINCSAVWNVIVSLTGRFRNLCLCHWLEGRVASPMLARRYPRLIPHPSHLRVTAHWLSLGCRERLLWPAVLMNSYSSRWSFPAENRRS